eukprot:scaffold3776_cov192-Alexandrium_tamarense.AAC.5
MERRVGKLQNHSLTMKFLLFLTAAATVLGFAPTQPTCLSVSKCIPSSNTQAYRRTFTSIKSSSEQDDDAAVALSAEDEAKLGNLVANEEWDGLSMELAEVIRVAIVEDVKTKSRDFIGKDDYAVGDFSKEIDRRVKEEVAKMRDKPEYELGDFSIVLDGKESVAVFCGKESYQLGDLSKELTKRTKNDVLAFTGKTDYRFGDVTKKLTGNLTGKDEYQFGDISKKLMGNLFNKK